MKISKLLAGLALCLGIASGANGADECSKELLLEYFPKQFVVETLKKYNVPQDKWDSIASALSSKDKDVVRIVEDKSSKLNPNPLKDRDPQQRQVAVKLFRETLLQVFNEALQANGITDTRQVQAMLDDIQQQKARNFAQCMERQKASQQPGGEPIHPGMQQPAEQTQVPAGAPEALLDEKVGSSGFVADNDSSDEGDSNDDNGDEDTKA